MFKLFRPRALPSAREVAIMIPLGIKKLELEKSHRAEKQLAILRKRAHEEIERMIKQCDTDGFISLVSHGTGLRFEPEAIAAFDSELQALGYETISEAGMVQLRIRVPMEEESERRLRSV